MPLDLATGHVPGDPLELKCACGVIVETAKALGKHKRDCPVARLQRVPGGAPIRAPEFLGHSEIPVPAPNASKIARPDPSGQRATPSNGREDGKASMGSERTSQDTRPFDVIKRELHAQVQAEIEELEREKHEDPEPEPVPAPNAPPELEAHNAEALLTNSANSTGDGKAGMGSREVPPSGPGQGRSLCPTCGEVKSNRWPCKKCSITVSPATPVPTLGRGRMKCPSCGAVKGSHGACNACGARQPSKMAVAPGGTDKAPPWARIAELRAALEAEESKIKNKFKPMSCYDQVGGNDYSRPFQ